MPSRVPRKGLAMIAGAAVGLALLLLWQGSVWETVWIDRARSLLPPEWRATEQAPRLATEHPIFRSNDTYYWAAYGTARAQGKAGALRWNAEENPPEGRDIAWHSGLSLAVAATTRALVNPEDGNWWQAAAAAGHWMPAFLRWLGAVGLSLATLAWLRHRPAPALFAGLAFFFLPPIAWDFHFSRLDHESVFQLALLVQFAGLARLVGGSPATASRPATLAGVVAGIGAALGWWISPTMQAPVGALSTLGLILAASPGGHQRRGILAWGLTGAAGILVLSAAEGRLIPATGLAEIQSLHALVQFGAGLFAASFIGGPRALRWTGLGLGLLPLAWLVLFGSDAHPWLDGPTRRLHRFISEFNSPFAQGGRALGAFLILFPLLALGLGGRPRDRAWRLWLPPALGLTALAAYQERWGGLAATAALFLILAAWRERRWLGGPLWAGLALLIVADTVQWARMEEKPGVPFSTDLILQVGARDVLLNLDAHRGEEDAIVAMPYDFAPPALAFPGIFPVGSLYWENRAGFLDTARLFAARDDGEARAMVEDRNIRFLVVQPGPMGTRFAAMAVGTATGSESEEWIRQSLAWRLSYGRNVPSWLEEIPFSGTLMPDRFGARIYRVRQRGAGEPE